MSNGGADRPAGISGTIPKVQINDLLLLTIVAKSTGSIIVLILELKSIANARIGKLGTNGTKRYNFIYYLRIIILLCEKNGGNPNKPGPKRKNGYDLCFGANHRKSCSGTLPY